MEPPQKKMESNVELNVPAQRTVIVFGSTGVGKSTLLNTLYSGEKKKPFLASDDINPVTKTVFCETCTWSEHPNYIIALYDTPGICKQEQLSIIQKGLQNLTAVSVIILVLNGTLPRITEEHKELLRFLREMFGDTTSNVFFVFTHVCEDVKVELVVKLYAEMGTKPNPHFFFNLVEDLSGADKNRLNELKTLVVNRVVNGIKIYPALTTQSKNKISEIQSKFELYWKGNDIDVSLEGDIKEIIHNFIENDKAYRIDKETFIKDILEDFKMQIPKKILYRIDQIAMSDSSIKMPFVEALREEDNTDLIEFCALIGLCGAALVFEMVQPGYQPQPNELLVLGSVTLAAIAHTTYKATWLRSSVALDLSKTIYNHYKGNDSLLKAFKKFIEDSFLSCIG